MRSRLGGAVNGRPEAAVRDAVSGAGQQCRRRRLAFVPVLWPETGVRWWPSRSGGPSTGSPRRESTRSGLRTRGWDASLVDARGHGQQVALVLTNIPARRPTEVALKLTNIWLPFSRTKSAHRVRLAKVSPTPEN
jgi:hypothetical protein